MTFRLVVPVGRIDPLRWVADVVLSQMLGVPVEIEGGADPGIVLSAQGRSLTMPSVFPDLTQARELWGRQMPTLPLARWSGETFAELDFEDPLPVLFGKPHFAVSRDNIDCGIDILGTAFFMLSRFEEVALSDCDEHDRFPGVASVAWKEGFLFHPVVDQYVELLFVMMQRLWPSLTRRRRQGRVNVSCDVDVPFDLVGANPVKLLRVLRHELLLKPRPAIALQRIASCFWRSRGVSRFDPFNNFSWYMDVCERFGHRAAFYFIADNPAGALDCEYVIEDPRIGALMRNISARGHELGMHGSYLSYHNGARLIAERERFLHACQAADLQVEDLGNRQHYLRWDVRVTPDLLEAAGLSYDTTGGYADRPGFRYGTAHPFNMWSWQAMAPLNLQQRPLVMMEWSVIWEGFLGLGYGEQSRQLMLDLKRRALRGGGDFNLLWHNSELLESQGS